MCWQDAQGANTGVSGLVIKANWLKQKLAIKADWLKQKLAMGKA